MTADDPKYYSIVRELAAGRDWEIIEPVKKGWSKDKKFRVKEKSGRYLQLRLSDISEHDVKKTEYERISMLFGMDLVVPQPVEFGICKDSSHVYMLITWIAGRDAETTLPEMDDAGQYKFGLKAGEALRKIHSVKGPETQGSWRVYFSEKIERIIHNYRNCGIRIENDENIIAFLRSSLGSLEGREITLQHGDYHAGNFIITDDGRLGIIDFNRSSYGDPWEEYDRYIFTWRVSIPFAIGQLHGYFDHEVPDDFFRLMSLYNAKNIIASIPWAVPFGERDVEVMRKYAGMVNECYDGFSSYVPNWYVDIADYEE